MNGEKILNKLDEILNEQKKQTKWSRFLAMINLKGIIKENLQTEDQRKIYSLSDGKNSTTEISKKLSKEGIRLSHMTVYNYWKRWNAIGLVEPSTEYKGRFKKIIDLEDLGIK